MLIRKPSARAAVALLLLALVAGPLAREAFAAADRHGCCPAPDRAADSPAPCQHVAALDCCGQLGVPATPASDASRATLTVLAVIAFTPLLPPPPSLQLAQTRNAHGPPPAALLRATVLQL